MKMKKQINKSIKLICTTALTLIFLTGCASSSKNAPNSTSEDNMTIVSTSVAICEILDALGFDNVIGIPETSNSLPERYSEATTVGSPMNPDFEIIKSLSPDLVISPKSLESSLSESYSSMGISSAFLDLSSVEGMYSAITSLGNLLGCEDEAEKLNNEYEEFVANFKSENDGDSPKVLLLMAFPDGFYLIGTENSYVGNLIKLAGGENVYNSSYNGDENGFVNINPEDVVQKDPDFIFVFAHYAEDDAFSYMENEFATSQTWQYFDAVKEGNIKYLPAEYFGMSADLSWTEGFKYLNYIMYGE